MNKRGFTLIELLVTLILCGCVILVMTCQFVTELKSYNIISDQTNATTDASLVMHDMERVLRYAKSSGTVGINNNANYSASVTVTIDNTGNLPEITANNTTVIFGRLKDATNTFQYVVGGGTPYPITQDITAFTPSWDSGNKELTFQITATRNGRSSSLESKVHFLGG